MTHPTRRTSARLALAAVALFAAATLVACGDDDDAADTTTTAAEQTSTTAAEASAPTVENQWVRPAADLQAMNRTAIYMDITGGSEDDALIAASVPQDVATVTEVHETVAAGGEGDGAMGEETTTTAMMGGGAGTETTMPGGGMMTMRQIDRIEIPAGETVKLEPGGYHVMVMDLQRPLVPGDTVEVTLTFEKAGEVVVTAEVREP